MRRIPILAALVLAAIIAASAWLVIEAQSDPQPLPTAEHLPRDDEQSEQQPEEAQSQPDEPEEESETEPSDEEQDPGQSSASQSDEAGSQEESDDTASSDETAVESSEADQLGESEQEEEPATVSDEDLPERRLIDALDIERRPHDQSAPAARQHVVVEGESLVGIANAFGVDVHRLADVNGFALEGILPVGEVLLVPSTFTYSPMQMPPGPERYQGGGLVWGTVTDTDHEIVHSLVVNFVDHRAGLPSAPDLVIGCISNRLVVELTWQPDTQPVELSDPPTDVRVYWRVNHGPLLTDRWRIADGVLSAPDAERFIDSLHGAVDLRLYPAALDSPFRFYWYPSVGKMVETPVQPNLDNCGR